MWEIREMKNLGRLEPRQNLFTQIRFLLPLPKTGTSLTHPQCLNHNLSLLPPPHYHCYHPLHQKILGYTPDVVIS